MVELLAEEGVVGASLELLSALRGSEVRRRRRMEEVLDDSVLDSLELFVELVLVVVSMEPLEVRRMWVGSVVAGGEAEVVMVF
jgi:hypothetical protein